MTITMTTFGLTWTDPDGTHRSSAVAYDKPSADNLKKELEAAGATNVLIIETKPGQLPEPAA
ncbi:hypothetical protein [Streptomyces prunicolor]|uniref:Uncharacterized protein n=1 Tax=Streptomyces prunicolor TaxID=67348 RepID=A0ABU4FIJ6_9ACTN|nr:hypothetical protein [Streptomyces prunicolor]MDV7220428.1 hypothetical protein [Streptomyces prunicolor]